MPVLRWTDGMDRATSWTLLVALSGVFAVRLYLAMVYEINWDEFLNLSMVHDYARGTLSEPLQTLFVRGFGWVAAVSQNEVDQVVAARFVMLLCAAITTALIVLTARAFVSLPAALFAGFCFAAFTFGLRQGASFRTDTIATTLATIAIAAVVWRPGRLGWAVVAGAAMGLAGMITIKAIFHAPSVAAICLIGLITGADRGRALSYGVVVALAAVLTFGVAFWLHSVGLPAPSSAFEFLDRTTGKTFAESESVVHRYWPAAILRNLVFAAALAGGLALTISSLSRRENVQRDLTVLALLMPAVSLIYYSEGYPYFFPFVLAPAAVLAGIAVQSVPPGAVGRVIYASILVIAAQGALSTAALVQRSNDWQHRVLATVHQMFPDPVAYIDHPSMVSSFPKTGFFMSAWGLSDYYARGEPLMESALRSDQPKFILANQPMLTFARLDPDRAGQEHQALLQADIEILRANFIPHWGPVAVAGKQLELTGNRLERSFEILIAGPYTLEAEEQVEINGRSLTKGDVIDLAPGTHRITAAAPVNATLRWGRHIHRPKEPAANRPLFTGF